MARSIDGFVHVPCCFLPQFYVFKEVVTCPEERGASEHLSVGLGKWRTNYLSDMLASAGVFIPLGVINFRYVPLRWRVPFLTCTSMLFPIILSTRRGKSDYATTEPQLSLSSAHSIAGLATELPSAAAKEAASVELAAVGGSLCDDVARPIHRRNSGTAPH